MLKYNGSILKLPSTAMIGYIEQTFEEWVNLGSTEYSKTSGTGTNHYSFTGMPESSDFNYITFIFDAYLASGGVSAADIFLENSSNGTIWRMRAHYNQGYPGFVGINANVTGWTTSSGAPSVGSFTQDGASYRYCSSKFTKGNYAKFKLVFDRNAKTCYTYIGDTLLGTVTLNIDPITIVKFGLMKETSSGSSAKMKNIKVAGFKYLSDAQNWN